MKRLSEKQKRSFKTYGIILIVIGFLLMYLAFSNYRSYSLEVTTGDNVKVVTVNFKSIDSVNSNGVSYNVKDDKDTVYQIYTSFGKEYFDYDLFNTEVAAGDEINIYLLYSAGTGSSAINVVSGLEKTGVNYIDRAKVEDAYLSSVKDLGKKIVIFIVASVVCVLGGAAFFIIRAIDSKKERQEYINEENKYLDTPTQMLPATKDRAYAILNNPKIKVLSQDDFEEKFRSGKYLDYFKVVNRLNNEYSQDERIKSINNVPTLELADLINFAFGKAKVGESDLNGFKSRMSYNGDFWLGLYVDEKLVGVLIGDLDTHIKEASIEYLAVLPDYQRLGYGKALVNHFLNLCKEKAKIVTVFTRADNPYHVLDLFKALDFEDEYHWFVLNKQDYDRLK